LSYLLGLFANNILPIFLASASGFMLAKYVKVNPRSISQLAFYIFSPSLVFKLLTSSQLNNSEVLRMGGFAVAGVVLIGLLAWLVGRMFRFERRLLVAVLLAVMFGNSGNYGLSLNLFAFGMPAMPYASLYFVVVLLLMYTLGVFLASLGSSGVKAALLGLFKVPAVYATAAALIVNQLGWVLPLPIDRTVTLLGDATIPTLMVLLGAQLYQSQWNGQFLALGLANGMRLLVAPFLAIGLAALFGLTGAAFQAGVAQSSMPTAVVMTILATEYDVEPSFISSVVFTSTLLSPLTVTPLLAYLGA
jgi:malate permease and related proteins